MIDEINATKVEIHIASIQRGSPKKVSYQRKEKLGGGKVSAFAEENDIGMTTRIGTARNTRPRMPMVASARRVQGEPPIMSPSSCGCLAIEAPVGGKDQQGHDQQDGRDRRGLFPSRDLVDQRVEQVRDHRHTAAAENGGGHVEAEAKDENQQGARRQRRQGEREIDLPE